MGSQEPVCLLDFIRIQVEMGVSCGWLLAIMGDMNSVVCPDLDTWQGTHAQRPACLAKALSEHGLTDAFRVRHPHLRGYTYYVAARVSSRIDAIMDLATPWPSGAVAECDGAVGMGPQGRP